MHKMSLVLLAICLQASDIRISEVMSNPQGSEYENEFIEVFNRSDHVTNIKGWLLSDGSSLDSISHLSGPEEIQAGGYAVILDPGYNFLTGPYSELLPDSVPVYTISTDASFGSGGLANAGESVIIWSPDSLYGSQMSWTMASENGFSWERVSLDNPDSLATWQQSLVMNGTPGFRNSVVPSLKNLSLNDLMVTHGVVGEPVELMLTIENKGADDFGSFSILFYRDDNQNEIQDWEEWELIIEQNLLLPAHQILEYTASLFVLEPGVHLAEARLIAAGDEVSGDDSLRFQVHGAYPMNAVSLTEIMFSPSPEQGGEWIEIKNISTEAISLQGWTLSDGNQTRHSISDQLFFLEPDCLLTLCADQAVIETYELASGQVLLLDSWPTLNASSDSVRLYDATGHPIVNGYYRGSWGAAGVSLERRHPLIYPLDRSNWAMSLDPDGGTPSRINSQQLHAIDVEIIAIDILNQTTTAPAQLNVVVHFMNQGLDTLDLLELESDADIEWHGELASFQVDSLSFNSPFMWPGYSILPIRLLHQGRLLADTLVQVVLGYPANSIALNEIHYVPAEDQVEFLEFVNTGSETVNLQGWTYEDRSGVLGSISEAADVAPGEFFVITPNAAALSDWAIGNTVIVELFPWPSLNNSSDSIVIKDPVGNLHIVHGYDAPSGSQVGKSLERLALWKAANLESSWVLCRDPMGMTPGRQNSVLLPTSNLALERFETSVSMLWIEESISVEMTIINTGVDVAEGAALRIQTFQGSVQLTESSTILPPIYSEDSLAWASEIVIQKPGWIELVAEIDAVNDAMTEDNRMIRRLYISGQTSPLIINEIFPLPGFEQSEWIEIYNRSDSEMDIQNWSIADDAGTPVRIADSSLLMEPRTYLILFGQSLEYSWTENLFSRLVPSFPTLNNSGDAVFLSDPQGIQMDYMSYDQTMELVEGRSLERISWDVSGSEPGNWSVCVDAMAATPGLRNSLHLSSLVSDMLIMLTPNPFTPNGDGMEDQLLIQYDLPLEHGLMSIMIFDMAGRRIAEPIQTKPVSHKGQLVWDGTANYGGIAVTGLYVMKLLVDDQAGRVWNELKKVYLIR